MKKNVMPIKPEDVGAAKLKHLPPEVIESFNELIARNFSSGSTTVLQKDVVSSLVCKGFKSEDIFENHWLDVEEIFEKNGWKVSYDKPGYNESYDASFMFSVKK